MNNLQVHLMFITLKEKKNKSANNWDLVSRKNVQEVDHANKLHFVGKLLKLFFQNWHIMPNLDSGPYYYSAIYYGLTV